MLRRFAKCVNNKTIFCRISSQTINELPQEAGLLSDLTFTNRAFQDRRARHQMFPEIAIWNNTTCRRTAGL